MNNMRHALNSVIETGIQRAVSVNVMSILIQLGLEY